MIPCGSGRTACQQGQACGKIKEKPRDSPRKEDGCNEDTGNGGLTPWRRDGQPRLGSGKPPAGGNRRGRNCKTPGPTMFGRAPEAVLREVERLRPDFVVSVGQAAGRTAITPERIAINCEEASIPDNAGFQPAGGPVVEGGRTVTFRSCRWKEMAAAIQAAGLPGKVSNTAGTYVCNHLMYHILHACHTRYPRMRSGFIHVPLHPRAAGGPSRMVCAPAGGDRAGANRYTYKCWRMISPSENR